MNIATAHPLVRWAILCVLMALTKLKFVHWLLPSRVRDFLLFGWDNEMMWQCFIGLGKKMYFDQPCVLPDPPSFKPLVEAKDPKNTFTEAEIKQFYDQGFFGPVTVFTPEQMAVMRKDIEEVLLSEKRKSKVYEIGKGSTSVTESALIEKKIVMEAVNGRDRHIDCAEIWNLMNQDPVKDRLAAMLGPDLIVWRSQFFNKMPGSPAVTWHSASTYLSEAVSEPVLRPKDINKLFQITTWFAIDDCDVENGCMHFIPGSHRKYLPVNFITSTRDDPNGKFAGIAVHPDHPTVHDFPLPPTHYTEKKVIAMPLKAGQCVMFFERTLHASPPNNSKDRRRMGITFRTIRSDCKVYGSRKWHGVTYLNTKFDLDKWGALSLRGNPGSLNRILPAPTK